MTIFPKITVITPSFNQGQYLEETILSVLSQEYPNLEYFVIDGGSSDNSVSIIRKYEPWITYWVSEPDRGQAHAINKGFEMCTGSLVGWINSDDLLLPEALKKFAYAHTLNPNSILLGDVQNFFQFQNKIKIIRQTNVTHRNMIFPRQSNFNWHQPGVYVPACWINKNFLLDENFRYIFDQDWLYRLLKVTDVVYLKQIVAKFRLHPLSKTVNEKHLWLQEQEELINKHWEFIVDEDKSFILANLEFAKSTKYLGMREWNSTQGKSHLKKALKYNVRILFSFKFINLYLRTFLPYKLLIFLRSIIIKIKVIPHE